MQDAIIFYDSLPYFPQNLRGKIRYAFRGKYGWEWPGLQAIFTT